MAHIYIALVECARILAWVYTYIITVVWCGAITSTQTQSESFYQLLSYHIQYVDRAS